jgi:threonine synthase
VRVIQLPTGGAFGGKEDAIFHHILALAAVKFDRPAARFFIKPIPKPSISGRSEMYFLTLLRCITCGREFTPQEMAYTCPSCGPLEGTLETLYDYDSVSRHLSRETLSSNNRYDMWRYLPLLPIMDPEKIPDMSVGWTPVYRSPQLENQLELSRVWVKDDGRNPTASLKDRASAVAVVKALEKDARIVTAASSGNAAASWSAFTAISGLKTVIFVPETAPTAKLAQLLLYGAHVFQVKGSYDQAFDLCCQAAAKWGWYNRSTAVNPYLGEGKKTAAFEICEQLDWEVPDYVLVGVGDGCIFQGIWKGFQEFYRLGLIDRQPKMVGVQAEGASPLVKAWQAGFHRVQPTIPKTLADSISVVMPRDQIKCLAAVRESAGTMISVADEDILTAMHNLAGTTGIMAEPAGAAGLAGLQKLVKEGIAKPRECAMILVTGHGLKDIDSVMKAAIHEPIRVDPTLTDVEAELKLD